jgi:hypothetical protein
VTVIVPVASSSVHDFWPLLEPWLQGIVDLNPFGFSLFNLKVDAEEAEIQLWMGWDPNTKECMGVAGTRVLEGFDGSKTVAIEFCTGKQRSEWERAGVMVIEQWAREIGANRVRPLTRPGWERVLKPLGYHKTHVMLEKDLT